MRISKETATRIAYKLSEKKKVKVEEAYENLKEFVTNEYEKQLPKEMIEVYKKFPKYIRTTSAVTLTGMGFNHERITLTKDLPTDSNGYYASFLQLTPELADEIMVLFRKHQKENDEYKKLLNELEITLLHLRTHVKIANHLPEAVPYLPIAANNELAINIDILRKEIE